eukprot:1193776-Prorocentrum_minimum.AAC.2
MEVERYSHVMHISSTVTGELKDELTSWDALRSALPAGTISGAPKTQLWRTARDARIQIWRGPLTSFDGSSCANNGKDALKTPEVRAMQIIDELEHNRRGPYGGGIGLVSFSGNMDISLALRTMVIPSTPFDNLFKVSAKRQVRFRINK